MIEIKLRELAQVIEGRLIGDVEDSVTSTVETDSRLISSGSLFFAKPGDKVDGHDFVADAIKNGGTVRYRWDESTVNWVPVENQ
jgi:UDP-N-acetylmuramoyl-tripeptide--D-alanyl-D-alanine ligase